jgi:hypothetical protein
MNSAIKRGSVTPIFSENSLSDKKSGTMIVSPFFVLRFCSISSILFSSFFFAFNLFDLVNPVSSEAKLFLYFRDLS